MSSPHLSEFGTNCCFLVIVISCSCHRLFFWLQTKVTLLLVTNMDAVKGRVYNFKGDELEVLVDKVEENKETFGKFSSTSTKDKTCDEVAVAQCHTNSTVHTLKRAREIKEFRMYQLIFGEMSGSMAL